MIPFSVEAYNQKPQEELGEKPSVTVCKCIYDGTKKYQVAFSDGTKCMLYRSDIKQYQILEGSLLTAGQYQSLLVDTLGKRARKRAMYLLEQMDRTEKNLRGKLAENGYPEISIAVAVDYVKRFHYLDDERYARNFVRLSQEKYSRQQIRQKLLLRGVERAVAEQALECEFQAEEMEQIVYWLEKKRFDKRNAKDRDVQKMYQFLLRKGYGSRNILKAIND